MPNLLTHPQPLLLKREGVKTKRFLSSLKVPLFLREGFRVSLLLRKEHNLLIVSPVRFWRKGFCRAK
ncbi:MAG: hypothetical protein V3V72_07075 [Ignavibacteriaceae bacterium]